MNAKMLMLATAGALGMTFAIASLIPTAICGSRSSRGGCFS